MNSLQLPVAPVSPSLNFIYTSIIEVDSPLTVGKTACGERRIINIGGGAFEGPRLSGKVPTPGSCGFPPTRLVGDSLQRISLAA